jgi:PTS system cellobiose-specific IIB component
MLRIVLLCSAGMSTSMLVTKMRKEVEATGQDIVINAYPEAELSKVINDIDVALLGPQVKFNLAKVKAVCDPKGIPVDVINPADYGLLNGKKVLAFALKLAGKA